MLHLPGVILNHQFVCNTNLPRHGEICVVDESAGYYRIECEAEDDAWYRALGPLRDSHCSLIGRR